MKRKAADPGAPHAAASPPGVAAASIGVGSRAILKGLVNIVAKLRAMALEELERQPADASSAAASSGGAAKSVSGIYGFVMRPGPGGAFSVVEPFGNIRLDSSSGEPIVAPEREPAMMVCDVLGGVHVVCEVPGVDAAGVDVRLQGRRLEVSAGGSLYSYRKIVDLPRSCSAQTLRWSCRNGVLDIACGTTIGPE